ncbi:VCBS repeat-containing protein, partial [bacterium]|nr:VCBS repeat-containing protein [bacterium]
MRALWYLSDLVYSIRHCIGLVLSLLVLAGCDSKPEGQEATAPSASSQETDEAVALSVNPPIEEAGEGEIIQASEGEISGAPAVTPASSPLEISATSNSRYLADVADDLVHLDPRKGGWVGEVINEAVGKRFNELKSFIEAGLTSTDSLSSILSDDFQCHPLRPEELAVGFEDKAVLVRRPAIDLDTVPSTRRGVDGFLLSLDEMLNVDGKSLRGLGTGSEIKAYFKIVGVEADRTSSQTRVLFELDLANSEGRSQQNATWICVWHPARERGGFPLLAEIRVVEYEEIFSPTTKGPLFVDSTESVLGKNTSYREQLAYGVDHWRERVDWRFTQEVTGPHGMAIGDVNGDDLDDLFFCETGGLPNRLFVQQEDGTLLDVSAASGLDYLEPTSSALIVDLDNDADQDLILSSGRNLLFFENDGKGTFRRRLIRKSDSVARSLSAIDFDL